MMVHKRLATIATIACLAFFGLVYGFAFPSTAIAWNNCPKGWVNDPYPGACRKYVDTNGDGICDLSQPNPGATTTTTSIVTTTTSKPTTTTTTSKPTTTATTKLTTITTARLTTTTTALLPASVTTTSKQTATTTTSLGAGTTTSGEPPTGDCPLAPCISCGACFGVSAGPVTCSVDPAANTGSAVEDAGAAAMLATTGSADTTPPSGGSDGSTIATSTAAADSSSPTLLTHYLVTPIAIGFFLVYAASFALYKTKRMRITTHRKIWNVLLLATFSVTGIFGLILAIELDYTLPFTIPIDLLFWHVETGIVMTLISFFHMGWHFSYYRNLLRSSRSKVRFFRAAERQRAAGERGLVTEAREHHQLERGRSLADPEEA
jgi:hypothetical protein